MRRTAFRRRQGWHGLIPRVDRTQLWPQRKWLWWVWDLFPPPMEQRISSFVDELRGRK